VLKNIVKIYEEEQTMPELITHCLVGEKVFEKLKDEKIKTLLENNKKEYLMGCQGGDLFFFYNYGVLKNKKSVPAFGTKLHVDHIDDFFKESIEYIKANPDDTLIAYFLGYICHYAADKQIHPFIYEKSHHDATKHHQIEFIMGKQFLVDTKGLSVKDYDMYDVFDFTLSDAILNFYIYIAKKLYQHELTKDLIKKCKQDFCDFKMRTKKPNFQYLLTSKLAKIVLKFDPMALIYKDENNWEYFTEAEYADFVADVLKTLTYSETALKKAFGYVMDDGVLQQEYLNCFDGTDFHGEKPTDQ
jgi:hypothetical protein